jgi:hypothetical protein
MHLLVQELQYVCACHRTSVVVCWYCAALPSDAAATIWVSTALPVRYHVVMRHVAAADCEVLARAGSPVGAGCCASLFVM